MHLLRYGANKRALRAFRERQETVASGLTRRELMKMGMMTSTGMLVSQKGLSRELLSPAALGTSPRSPGSSSPWWSRPCCACR